MSENDLDDIKRRLDIVEFIGSYVTLKKAGTNYKGLCPFHNEKTPSMMVSPEKQIFKCFGCNEGGDIYSFLMKAEGLSFGDALKILADKAGVKLERGHFDNFKTGEKPGQKTRLIELQELAAKLYHKILIEHPAGKVALDYLEKRGITRATIDDFNLGYAPASWDLLIRFAESRGFTEKELLVSGLTVRKTTNVTAGNRVSYDRFRERIVFPINNVLGQTVGFTGRIIIDKAEAPKYLNSSESPIYQKSQVIYGLDKAKMAIKQADLAVIVEGNMDVIACHQAGFKNVVAVSGTALTKDMLLILSRYTFNIAFSFDSDNAGKLALKRAIGLAGELDLNTKIIHLDEKFKDPDEAIKADPKNWEEATKNAPPALEFLINILTKEASDIGGKKAVIKEILPTIKLLKSPTEQEHFIKMLAMKLVVNEKSLFEELKTVKATEISESTAEPVITKTADEVKILSILAEKPEILGDNFKSTIKAIAIGQALSQEFRQKLEGKSEAELSKLISAEKLEDKLKPVFMQITQDLDADVELKDLAAELAKKIRRQAYENKKGDLVARISAIDPKTNKEERLRLLKELNSVIIGGE